MCESESCHKVAKASDSPRTSTGRHNYSDCIVFEEDEKEGDKT